MKYIIMFKLHIGVCLAPPTQQGHTPSLKNPKNHHFSKFQIVFRNLYGRGVALYGGSGQTHPNMKFEHDDIFQD